MSYANYTARVQPCMSRHAIGGNPMGFVRTPGPYPSVLEMARATMGLHVRVSPCHCVRHQQVCECGRS
eukprot:7171269-Pyramimonas_sp.AAC.1